MCATAAVGSAGRWGRLVLVVVGGTGSPLGPLWPLIAVGSLTALGTVVPFGPIGGGPPIRRGWWPPFAWVTSVAGIAFT